MKFLVDAQLPRRLAGHLRDLGHDAVHTLELPLANRTPDTVINEISLHEQRVVITKDSDFVNSFVLHHRPFKLLLIATGNITNRDLEQLFHDQIDEIAEAFQTHHFLELDRETITYHV